MQDITNLLLAYGWFIGIPLIFLAVVLYVMQPNAKQRYREDAEIPFRKQERSQR